MLLAPASVLAAALVAAPTATAATSTPCWQRVLTEWTNGNVQSSYAAGCYAEALSRLPTDVRMYSDAGQEIRRAMLAAIRKGNEPPPSPARSNGERSAAARTSDARARSLPLPILAGIGLALALVALGVAARLRARRRTDPPDGPLEG